jgi:hypothetical protein
MKIPKFIFVLVVLLCSGCGRQWVEHREPMNDDERTKIAAYVEKVMESTPKSLAGHDQDWDDAIKAAHYTATQIYCRPTFWEWDGWSQNYTGRWRYMEEPKP